MKPEESLVQASPSAASIYANGDNFMMAQRMAQSLAASSMVPEAYRGQNGLANCIVALELANRLNTSPLMIMQNVHVVHGRPMWSSQFLIGLVNSSGRYSPLRFVYDNQDEPTSCYAMAIDKASGEVLRGTRITLDMAQREGWSTKNGSKWKTMPAQMLMYRAASFWARAYASDLTLGIRPQDEVTDIEEVVVTAAPAEQPAAPAPAAQAEPEPEPAAPEIVTRALAAAAKASTPAAVEAVEVRAAELHAQGRITDSELFAILRALPTPEPKPDAPADAVPAAAADGEPDAADKRHDADPAPVPDAANDGGEPGGDDAVEPAEEPLTEADYEALAKAIKAAKNAGEVVRSLAQSRGLPLRSPIGRLVKTRADIAEIMGMLQ